MPTEQRIPPRRVVSDTTQKHVSNPVQYETRKEAVKDLISLPMIPLGILGTLETIRNDGAISPYSLDVVALDMHSEQLADGIVQIAERFPVLGAVLDRVGNVTPFGAILAAGMGLAFQIAENHGTLPEQLRTRTAMNPSFTRREDLARQLKERAEAIARNGADA